MELNINDQKTINTTASVVSIEKSNNNGERSSIILTNTSTGGETITVAIGAEAVANKGIVLGVGSVWADTRDGGYIPTQSEITAIASGIGALLSVQERVRR